MKNPLILGGSSSEHLAIKTADILGLKAGELEVKRFPDGELYIRILDDVSGRDVLYINSLQPQVNESLIETLLTIDAIHDLGARSVTVVVPYLAYARQDERFKEGEAVSIMTVAKLFRSMKVDRMYTIDMHLHRISDPKKIFGSNFENLSAIPLIGEYFRDKVSDRTVIIGPDEEAIQWARKLSESLGGLDYGVLEKERKGPEEVVIRASGIDVGGRDVLLVDDIISTGGTIVEAVKALRRLGAKRISVACVHPVLSGRAYPRILRLGVDELACTDTILSPISYISVAPLIGSVWKK